MALAKQAVELAFGTGVDESVQKEVLDPMGNVSMAHNVAVAKHGSFAKREGLGSYLLSILGGGNVTSGVSIHDFDESYPVITDDTRLYDYSTASSSWAPCDLVPEAVVSRVPSFQSPAFGATFDAQSVICGNYRVTAAGIAPRYSGEYADGDTPRTYVQIADVTTGAIVYGPTLLTSSDTNGTTRPICFSMVVTPDNRVTITAQIITYSGVTPTAFPLRAWVFNLATPSAAPLDYLLGTYPGPTALPAILVAAPEARGNDIVYLFSMGGDATTVQSNWTWKVFRPSTGAVVQTVSNALTNLYTSQAWAQQTMTINHDAAANVVTMMWLDSAGPASFRVATYNATTFAPIVASTQFPVPSTAALGSTISTCLGEVTLGSYRDVWVTKSEAVSGGQVSNVRCYRLSVVAGSFVFTRQGPINPNGRRCNIAAMSNPFNRAGRWYQWFVTTPWAAGVSDLGNSQRNSILCEVRDDMSHVRPVASVAQNLISETNPTRYPRTVALSSPGTFDNYEVPVLVVRNAVITHVELAAVSFTDKRRMMGAQFGDVLALSASCPSVYDGDRVYEQGFVAPPSIAAIDGAPGSPVGPADFVAGTYSFFAVWCHIDAKGNVHRSAPSNIVTLTFATTRSVTASFAPLVITSRIPEGRVSSVRLEFYQTRANEGTFYLGESRAQTYVDTQAATGVSSILLRADDRNRLFYTQPGVPGAALFKYPPPPLRGLIQHNTSLAGIAEDGRTIWFSGQHLAGEGPWYNPAFVAYVDDPSQLTALASMDGRLFAFTRTSIWALDGPGFADNGEGGYGPPIRVAVDSGCISEKSVVVTPLGILYQTDLGISLLSRSGEIVPFGRMVEDTLKTYSRITSAVLSRGTGEVRFTCVQPFSNLSVWLTYDYRNQLWFTASPGTNIATTTEIVGACLSTRGALSDPARKATWHILYADGRVAYSVPGSFTDNAVPFPVKVETGWLKVAGLQGFQRIWRVMFLFGRTANSFQTSSVGIKVSLLYDYVDDVVVEERTWTGAELNALLPLEAVEIHCKRQKCTAIKVRIETVESSAAPFDFLGLRFICGVKAKTPRGALAR